LTLLDKIECLPEALARRLALRAHKGNERPRSKLRFNGPSYGANSTPSRRS